MLQKSADDRSFASSLIIWIAVQLLAIGLGAMHIRLWASAPLATETLALDELLVAQFLASCLLFPVLCRTWQSTVAMVIGSIPMIAVAGMLGGVEDSVCIGCWFNVSMWVVGLFFCRRVVATSAAQMISVAAIFSLNFTGIVMCYLIAEMKGSESYGRFIPLGAAMRMTGAPLWPSFLPGVIWLTCTALVAKFFASSYPQNLSTGNA